MLAVYISFCISSSQAGQVLFFIIFLTQMLLLKLCDMEWLVQGHTAAGGGEAPLASMCCPQSTIKLSPNLWNIPSLFFLLILLASSILFSSFEHFLKVSMMIFWELSTEVRMKEFWIRKTEKRTDFSACFPFLPNALLVPATTTTTTATKAEGECHHTTLQNTVPKYLNGWSWKGKYFFSDHLTRLANDARPQNVSQIVPFFSIPTSPALVPVLVISL